MVAAAETSRRQARILVTDDDRRWREGLRSAFEPLGYETLEADTGEAAIDLVQQAQPHLMILDIQLPRLSGIETLRIIRQEMGDELPAIIVSSQVDDEVLAAALALHAFTVLSKMAGIQRILYTVARVLAKYYAL